MAGTQTTNAVPSETSPEIAGGSTSFYNGVSASFSFIPGPVLKQQCPGCDVPQ